MMHAQPQDDALPQPAGTALNTSLIWSPDVLPSFEQTTLTALAAADGPVELVLVRRRCATPTGRAVLYVHGFVDYFFQTHLADFFNQNGLDFYALDLRRHGRSLRPHQLPCYTSNIFEYLQDVDTAIDALTAHDGIHWLLLNGHSTGGLVVALHAHRGRRRDAVNAVCLNSPFLDMNLPSWQKWSLQPLLVALGAVLPHLRLPGLSHVYAQSLHVDHHGAWRFDTRWKPIEGFTVYAGWFRAIALAQAEVARGLNLACPVLLLHAQRSARLLQWSEAAMGADMVLNVADMVRLAPRLGAHVDCVGIEDGIHDLVLSRPSARKQVFAVMQQWLEQLQPTAALASN